MNIPMQLMAGELAGHRVLSNSEAVQALASQPSAPVPFDLQHALQDVLVAPLARSARAAADEPTRRQRTKLTISDYRELAVTRKSRRTLEMGVPTRTPAKKAGYAAVDVNVTIDGATRPLTATLHVTRDGSQLNVEVLHVAPRHAARY